MTDTNIQDAGGVFTPSDYKLAVLTIITSDGVTMDIRNAMVEMDVYEDIFSPVITGSVTLGDGGDIISALRMHGNEYLAFEVDKPGLNMPITKVFRIYKISTRSFGSVGMQNYTIHFCSEELILSAQSLISKSYKGLTIDMMVDDILRNKLKVDDKKLKNGIFTPTSGNFDLIIPRLQPLRAIEWLTPRAYSDIGKLYFFFENRDGFNFTSFEDLIAKPSYSTYSRDVKVSRDPSVNFTSPNFIGVIQDFDILKSLRFGAYNSTLLTLDLVNRKVFTKTFGYADLDEKDTLNKSAPVNLLKNRLGVSLLDSTESMVKYIVTSDSDQQRNPADVQNWMPQTSSRLAQINAFKIGMHLPGDLTMKAGVVINLIMPKITAQDKTVEVDELRTGRYLVSAVHHKFIGEAMSTIIEILSDSVGKIAQSADGSEIVQKVVTL